jgi:hypothetical protein
VRLFYNLRTSNFHYEDIKSIFLIICIFNFFYVGLNLPVFSERRSCAGFKTGTARLSAARNALCDFHIVNTGENSYCISVTSVTA